MERLFSPCTRLRDLVGSQDRLERFRDHYPELWQELNLDVSTEVLLSAERAFTYADLYALLGNEDAVAWLTPHAAITRPYGIVAQSWESVDESHRSFSFVADGKEIIAMATSPEHLLEICDVFLRLVAASVVHAVTLHNYNHRDIAMINAASLAYLMEQCQSLKILTLQHLALDENQVRVLGTYSRPDLEICLEKCQIAGAAAEALAEVLGRNQGPTTLDRCDVDNIVLADGLRGNSRLRSLQPCTSSSREVGNRQVLAIAGALRENKGLIELNLNSCWVSDETWGAACDSLKTHPTLEVLHIRLVSSNRSTAPAVITSRIQPLVDMLKVNMSIHNIHLDSHPSQHELFRELGMPYLRTNKLRPRLLAIQKIRPIAYRAGVLGRALFSVRTDPNRFWMLLSGNPEVAFLPTTATIAVVAATATAAAAAATSTTANVLVHLSLDRTLASSSL
jgi:hypothetical protein